MKSYRPGKTTVLDWSSYDLETIMERRFVVLLEMFVHKSCSYDGGQDEVDVHWTIWSNIRDTT